MMTDVDVVVIGGGPAGATCATLLAAAGHTVVVVEKDEFPRYHIGESLISGMLPTLRRTGVLDRLRDVGFEDKWGLSLRWGRDRELWPINFRAAGVPEPAMHVDRAVFDQVLLEQAGEAGAEIRQPVKVTGISGSAGQWTVTLSDSETIRCGTVVDASGQTRTFGKEVTSVRRNETLRNVATWSYFTGYERQPEPNDTNILVEKSVAGDGWIWAIPLPGERLSVGVVRHATSPSAGNHDRLREAILDCPHLAKMLRHADEIGPCRTARDWSYRSERLAGPGWYLVGDAAAFIDPLLSTGVNLGILEAEFAADSITASYAQPEAAEQYARHYDERVGTFVDAMTDYVEYFYQDSHDDLAGEQLQVALKEFVDHHPASDAFQTIITGAVGNMAGFSVEGAKVGA